MTNKSDEVVLTFPEALTIRDLLHSVDNYTWDTDSSTHFKSFCRKFREADFNHTKLKKEGKMSDVDERIQYLYHIFSTLVYSLQNYKENPTYKVLAEDSVKILTEEIKLIESAIDYRHNQAKKESN